MTILLYIGITLVTFVLMEGVTWLTHKYVMHGFLWCLHEDHHQPKYTSVFEKNDLFFVIFAIPSILLFYYGVHPALNFKFFIGLGILLYGIGYFLIHDVMIHRRFKWLDGIDNWYLNALRKGHKVHHKYLTKEDGESFGMLWVPLRFFKEKRKDS
jgi:beta-carotene 3-hydroxylase